MSNGPGEMGRMAGNLLNYALYQAGWFACVLGAAAGQSAVGASAAAVLLAGHLLAAGQPGRELRLCLCAAALGCILDSAQGWADVIAFAGPPLPGGLCPAWILVMWAQFATLLPHALGWLLTRPLLGAILGAVGGPLAYYAGFRLGAAAFPSGIPRAVAWMAVEWAIATPLLLWMARRTVGRGAYRWLGSATPGQPL